MANGEHSASHHTPSASVQQFEELLGAVIGQRRCGHCRLPLGNEPRRLSGGVGYHPPCAEARQKILAARSAEQQRREATQGQPFWG